MKIGIVGYGTVGKAHANCFSDRGKFSVSVYDKFIEQMCSSVHRKRINDCDLVFVCVPTPSSPVDGFSCDISAVEDAVSWIEAPVCIKSTVVPGTTDHLSRKTGRSVVFSPEYIGESASHPWKSIGACGFVIVGGADPFRELVTDAYRTALSSDLVFYGTSARAAELCKYMENCFLATKVAFVNQFFDISASLGVDFEELRNLWLADRRIGASHTQVTKERGFGGRCLPKDIRAMIAIMKSYGGAPLLDAVAEYNEELRQDASGRSWSGRLKQVSSR